VLANGSMSSSQNNEGQIRAAMVEADVVEVMVALPGQLFFNTQIPACLWFLAKDKKRNRRARCCSSTPASSAAMISRVQCRAGRRRRDQRIAGTVAAWRGEVEAGASTVCRRAGLLPQREAGRDRPARPCADPGPLRGRRGGGGRRRSLRRQDAKLTEKLGEQMAKGAELDA
jgi:type I restriction enzyme M protein